MTTVARPPRSAFKRWLLPVSIAVLAVGGLAAATGMVPFRLTGDPAVLGQVREAGGALDLVTLQVDGMT